MAPVGSVRFGIPQDLAADLVEAGPFRAAVETGTYKGESAAFLRTLCPRVWSIELSPAQHAEATAAYGGIAGLSFAQGNSATILPDLLEGIGEPALFWFDGHVMPGDPNFGAAECPVIAEIEAVNAWSHGPASCILIDDAVLFHAAPQFGLRPAEWPMITEVVDLLRAGTDRYVTVLDDVVIAGPMEFRAVVDRWWGRVIAERGGRPPWCPSSASKRPGTPRRPRRSDVSASPS